MKRPQGENAMRPQSAAMMALLNEPVLRIVPGCGDALGARLIEESEFKMGFASGASVSAHRLALPDMDLLAFPEMRDAVDAIINAAPGVLWIADGDTGYGNAISVQKTVRAYARVGAAAVLIEDKVWPRPIGNGGKKLVIERDEAVLRCRAAVQACREEGILLVARTDARASRGFEEALARIQDFVAEGADMFFLDSPHSEEEMRRYVECCQGRPAQALKTPAGTHFMPSDDELARIGIRVVAHPLDVLACTIHAIRGALAGLKGGAMPAMATPAEISTAIRRAEYLALEERLS
jgi:2-methylisocitrate lyase-like PEP mutase family enzyme